MNRTQLLLTTAAVLLSSASVSAQTAQGQSSPGTAAATPQAKSRPQKQLDIGAAEAPLSDSERDDLDAAVTKHDYPAEKAVIDKALSEHPNSYELLVMWGRLAYLERKPKDAVEALERADKVKPLSESDRLTLAIAYQFSEKPEQAHAELLKLEKLAPANAQYPFLLGRMDAKNQHLEAAADNFAKAIRLDPNLVRAYQELGQIQEELGHAEEARKTYEAGATINRKLPAPWEWSPLDLGVVFLKANDLPEAEKLFSESLQYKPRFGWGHYYLGQVFQKQGKDAEAVAEYKEAVVDEPRLRQAWLALGREFKRQGNDAESDRALAIFKKLEEQENAAKGKMN